MTIPSLPGIKAQTIRTEHNSTRVLTSGDGNIAVLFVHGNISSATFWEETMLAMPEDYYCVAPDLRGYGDAEASKKIDARRGLRDFCDDIVALMNTLNISVFHVIGHSLGASILWQLMQDIPERLLSATLVAPGSPYGFGAKTIDGQPYWDDYSGSGVTSTNIVLAKWMQQTIEGEEPLVSIRHIMNTTVWNAPFIPERENELLAALLTTHLGDNAYPGDYIESPNFPFMAPGIYGANNALSIKYQPDIQQLYQIQPKPRILWIRGSDDLVISDSRSADPANLGLKGLSSGYPGQEIYPAQAHISQTRYVLEQYQASGGSYSELVLTDVGHSPYIEKPDEFNAAFHKFLEEI